MVEILLPVPKECGLTNIKIIHGERLKGDVIRNYSDTTNYETILITSEIINSTIGCSILNKIFFWDSLISTAESAFCNTLWTEDLNDIQVIKKNLTDDKIAKLINWDVVRQGSLQESVLRFSSQV